MRDYRDIIIRPIVTEKSMNLLADNKYTFIVDGGPIRSKSAKAIEDIYSMSR